MSWGRFLLVPETVPPKMFMFIDFFLARFSTIEFQKNLVSAKFLSAILGPEMAAPILWAPRISALFLQENLHVHKIPRFRGGGRGILGFEGGGGSANFIFMGAGIFLRICTFKNQKNSVFGRFSSVASALPPQKRKFYFIVVSLSLINRVGERSRAARATEGVRARSARTPRPGPQKNRKESRTSQNDPCSTRS